MTRRIVVVLVLFACTVVLFTGCVFPGSGTVRIRNEMTASRVITSLYMYLEGSSSKGSSIASEIHPNEIHTEYGVEPGDYIIEAEIDGGLETAIDTVSVVEGTWHVVWFYDGDIL